MTTTDLVLLGTDTDAGKTTLALLWLETAAPRYEYWKPLESGQSDTEQVRRCVPSVHVHAPLLRFSHPVAPLLAARQQGQSIPSAQAIAAAKPAPTVSGRRLLIETFGGPFSPLNEDELQAALIQALGAPAVLVGTSALGAVGRTLQTLHALKAHAVTVAAVVLFGPVDSFAVEQIALHWPEAGVFSLEAPRRWDQEGIALAVEHQRKVLSALEACIVEKGSQRQAVASERHSAAVATVCGRVDGPLPPSDSQAVADLIERQAAASEGRVPRRRLELRRRERLAVHGHRDLEA